MIKRIVVLFVMMMLLMTTGVMAAIECKIDPNGGLCIVKGIDESEIVIPDSIDNTPVTSIGPGAFDHCQHLKSITLPDTLVTISEDAFRNCSMLESVRIPDGVRVIGDGAFEECGLRNVTLPETLTEIGRNAFRKCWMKEISIPSSVIKIGAGAFSGCYVLSSFSFPETITEISDKVLQGCSELTSVTIPDSVIQIGSEAFSSSGLTDCFLPEGVTEIKENAFELCLKLTSVRLPASLRQLGPYAFSRCVAIETLTIPSGVVSIGERAFEKCRALKTLVFPDTLQTIGDSAFYECESLTEVTLSENVTAIGRDAFRLCAKKLVFRCPEGSAADIYAQDNRIDRKRSGTAASPLITPEPDPMETIRSYLNAYEAGKLPKRKGKAVFTGKLLICVRRPLAELTVISPTKDYFGIRRDLIACSLSDADTLIFIAADLKNVGTYGSDAYSAAYEVTTLIEAVDLHSGKAYQPIHVGSCMPPNVISAASGIYANLGLGEFMEEAAAAHIADAYSAKKKK